MIHGLSRLPQLGFLRDGSAGIWIAVKPWEVAARNFHTDAMTLQEYVAGDSSIHCDVISLARNTRRRRFFQRFTIAQAQNAVGEVTGRAVRKDVD